MKHGYVRGTNRLFSYLDRSVGFLEKTTASNVKTCLYFRCQNERQVSRARGSSSDACRDCMEIALGSSHEGRMRLKRAEERMTVVEARHLEEQDKKELVQG